MRKKVLVLGANFGGLTAALAVKHEMKGDVDVTVVSPRDHFLFNPSLIWLPFGKRDRKDITFPVAPTFESHGVDFVHAGATAIDPVAQTVTTDKGQVLSFDYLVIATGYYNKDDFAPGFKENAVTITMLPEAERAAAAWKRYLDKPGDVVIAASQGAGCFGAAYEFLFNTAYQLKKAGLKDKKVTFVTSEPFLGHFGIGGLKNGEKLLGSFLKMNNIDTRISTSIESIEDGAVVLADGEKLKSSFTMVVPPFLGQEFLVNNSGGLADPKGYVKIRDTYQTVDYDNIYAVGIAAAVPMPFQTPVPIGIPKTGFPTEVMAHIAAENIAAQIKGKAATKSKNFGDIRAVCVLDAGNNGVILLADKMLPPRKRGTLIPGPQAHMMKLGFEKYFLWKSKNGHVSLP